MSGEAVIYVHGMSESALDVERELAERFAAAYDDNGVDRTLVRESLTLTPTERLARLDDFLETLATVRRVEHAPAEANS